MASLLRQIVAGPRSRHPETGLDLCYVTSQIIATSGPSPSTSYKQLYRNPLEQLVRYLDSKHGSEWQIWEFRAEGTGYPDDAVYGRVRHYPWPDHHPPPFRLVPMIMASMRNWLNEDGKDGRVVVVHCKAGKGRSGTISSSYLISECGWEAEEALARFTERRMRPGFGQGVSIPSQLRWVGYVDRWTRTGKVYVERQIEVLEVHVWGLKDGVKVQVESYVNEGKQIKIFHTFNRQERFIVDGITPSENGFAEQDFNNRQKLSSESPSSSPSSSTFSHTSYPGGSAVIFRPSTPIIIPTSDINIDFERRNKASMGGWTMVTSVAHVWFNAYFEGLSPENDNQLSESGVFEIEWDKMDGIKGSSRKGTRALDRLAVVWKACSSPRGGEEINEPGIDAAIPQMAAADWNPTRAGGKDLGLRTESPASAEVSKASSIKSTDRIHNGNSSDDEEEAGREGVKSSGPEGEEELAVDVNK